MKEQYHKPELVTDGNVGSVFPAGLAGAAAAFVTGVGMATQVKKMLNGRVSFGRERQLVEMGEASIS